MIVVGLVCLHFKTTDIENVGFAELWQKWARQALEENRWILTEGDANQIHVSQALRFRPKPGLPVDFHDQGIALIVHGHCFQLGVLADFAVAQQDKQRARSRKVEVVEALQLSAVFFGMCRQLKNKGISLLVVCHFQELWLGDEASSHQHTSKIGSKRQRARRLLS